MIIELKEQFYNLISSLGYNVTDNGNYKENFPWLMLRTNGYGRQKSFDINFEAITLTLDIFSTYSGEKEILEIVNNIADNLDTLQKNNSAIIYAQQKSCTILDDKSTGPVRKHGVVAYQFGLASGIVETEVANEE